MDFHINYKFFYCYLVVIALILLFDMDDDLLEYQNVLYTMFKNFFLLI